MTDILVRGGKCRHRHTGRMPCDHRSRDWSDMMTSQGIPRIAGNHQQSEEAGNQKEPLVALVWVFATLSVMLSIVGDVPGKYL